MQRRSTLHKDVVALHIATSTNSLKKGFPPPICHKLVGIGLISLSQKGMVEIMAQSFKDDERELLSTLSTTLPESRVANFVPFRFTLPVLRGASYRTGLRRLEFDNWEWYDVGEWFGNGQTSMSDVAVATGLAQRHPLDIALALRDERLGDIEDQLLIDAFLTLCAYLRQQVVEDRRYNAKLYRKIVSDVRKKVRTQVKDKTCKQYVSWKGMLDKKLFLLK